MLSPIEERWTRSTIQAAFALCSLPRKSSGVSIDLPLLHLGWTFALSLIPEKPQKKGPPKRSSNYNWIPAAFSFRQRSDASRWGNAAIRAEISLGEGRTPLGSVDGNSTPLGEMHVVLALTPSLELPLSTSCTLSSPRSDIVWLTVTISECPFPDGLFDARYGLVSEAEIQAQLLGQRGDYSLSQILTTGKLVDVRLVRFLTFSVRSASGNTGEPIPTYASLPVVEEHINLSSSVLKETWTKAVLALDNTDMDRVAEIACPEDYEYELDSDLEDGDEILSSCDSGAGDLVASEVQHRENITERSSSSLSSFELEGADDQGSVDNQLEELIKDAQEAPSSHERRVWVKFAAHRTWHAFLWYCYTGHLKFGKLRSQVEPGGRHLRVTPLEGGPPTCSPKSMYRLADLIGDENLKAKALVAIKERMTETNVLDETFSNFTSRYPDVWDAQLGVLMKYRGSPEVKKAFLRAMVEYGKMPHAEPVLSTFFDNLWEVKI